MLKKAIRKEREKRNAKKLCCNAKNFKMERKKKERLRNKVGMTKEE